MASLVNPDTLAVALAAKGDSKLLIYARKGWFSVPQASILLGVGVQTIRSRISSGKILATRVSGRYRISVSELIRVVREQHNA